MRVPVIVAQATALVVPNVPCYYVGNNALPSLKIHPSSLRCHNHQFSDFFPNSVPLQEADLLPLSLRNSNLIIISCLGLRELPNTLIPLQSTLLMIWIPGQIYLPRRPLLPLCLRQHLLHNHPAFPHIHAFAFSHHALSDVPPSFKIHFQYHLP